MKLISILVLSFFMMSWHDSSSIKLKLKQNVSFNLNKKCLGIFFRIVVFCSGLDPSQKGKSIFFIDLVFSPLYAFLETTEDLKCLEPSIVT